MKKCLAGIIAAIIACLIFTGCANQHDKIYSDDSAIAGEDKFMDVVFMGNSSSGGGYSLTTDSHSGARTIWRHTEANQGQDITLDYYISVEEGGSAKLVLVAPDKTVVTVAEPPAGGEESGSYTFTPQAGKYRLKLVAKGGHRIKATVDTAAGDFGQE